MDKEKEIPIEECREVIEGATPHGGVRMELYFFDEHDNLCRKKDALFGRLIEKDKDGNTIFEVYRIILNNQ